MKVIKRDGRTEDLQPEKYMLVVTFGCEGIARVSASDLALRTYQKLYDGITTRQLHDLVIRTAVDMIEIEPNYDRVAARLLSFGLRKDVYGTYEVPPLKDIVTRGVEAGVYSTDLLNINDTQWDVLDSIIKHDRDNTLTYAAMCQFVDKYLVQDRSDASQKIYETPQVSYLLGAATLYMNCETGFIAKTKAHYDSVSTYDFSLPTPVLAGVRTPEKQFSSCVLIDSNDSLSSINRAGNSIVDYASQKAGIGLHVGKIRALGSSVRSGSTKHTGIIPFIKKFKGDLKCCSQGGVRGSSATLYYPWWHYEFPELVVLKNNQGTEESRERHLDYGVEFSALLMKRYMEGSSVFLMSPAEVPEMRDAFYAGDFEAFEVEYKKASANPNIRKREVSAEWLLHTYLTERQRTSRIYAVFMENMYQQGAFMPEAFLNGEHLASNLCLEIALPIKSSEEVSQGTEDDLIALCTLSSANWGKLSSPTDLEKPCRLMVRYLDGLLSYQNYPCQEAKTFTEKYRALGIGVVGFAHFLAKNGLKYNKKAAALVDEYMEHFMYYLIDESVELAKEHGPCEGYKNTCYGQGIFPWERRNLNVDHITPMVLRLPWEELRQKMLKYGIRNATLSAVAPTESSSQLLGETNGIEPPKQTIVTKASKTGVLKQVVPQYGKLKNKYDYVWDQEGPKGYLSLMAVIQKWVDQAISSNTSYNPTQYVDDKIPMSEMVQDFFFAYMSGVKTLYYFNTMSDKDHDKNEPDQMSENDCCVI